MYFKINLQILIIIFIIILILLILFKNNLRSVFTKYNTNKSNFLIDSSGNTYPSAQAVYMKPYMNDLNISYNLPYLTNHWGDTSAVGPVAGTQPARWVSTPLIYIFDPSGQAAGNTMESAYQPGGALYNIFNKSYYNQSPTFNTAFLTVYPSGKFGTINTALGISTPFSDTNYPPNLWNSNLYGDPNSIWRYIQNGKVGVVQNFKYYDSATASTTSVGTHTLFSSASVGGTLTVSFTFCGDYIHQPMVIGRTYIIGIAHFTTAKRASNDPPSTMSPPLFDGKCTKFIYKGFVPTADNVPISIAFNPTVTIGTV